MAPPLPLVVGRRDPPVLLSLLLSAARPALDRVGKITLLNILERHLFAPASYQSTLRYLSPSCCRAWVEVGAEGDHAGVVAAEVGLADLQGALTVGAGAALLR